MWQNVLTAGPTWRVCGYSEYFFNFSVKNSQVKSWGNKGPSLAPSPLVLVFTLHTHPVLLF